MDKATFQNLVSTTFPDIRQSRHQETSHVNNLQLNKHNVKQSVHLPPIQVHDFLHQHITCSVACVSNSQYLRSKTKLFFSFHDHFQLIGSLWDISRGPSKIVTYLIHQIAHGHPEVYIWSCLFAELKDEGAWTTLPAFRTVSSSHGILKYLISHIYIEVKGVEVERRGRGESCRVTLTAKT